MNKQHPLYQEDLNYILSTKGIEKLRGKKLLITGATGLIGLCLIDALMLYNQQGADIHIYAVGRNMDKAAARLGDYYQNPLFNFIQQDATQPFAENVNVDYILPLASMTHPLAYSQMPIETILTNFKGAENALELACRYHAIVLYPSTVEVYGNARGEDTFIEDYTGNLNLKNSRSCYPESKRLSEALCQSYITERNVDVRIVRLSRVFGPTMLATDTKASSQFINNALQGCDIVLKSEGNQLFSYTYVAEAVSGILYVMLHGETGVPYNIANKQCDVRLKDFAGACANYAGRKVVFDLPNEIERRGYSIAQKAILDGSRLNNLGWTAKYSFADAVNRTCDILK